MESENKTVKQLIQEMKETGIISVIDNGVSIQDTNFKILYQNQMARDLMGDHVGKYCYKSYMLRTLACDDCSLSQGFSDGNSHKAEKSVTTDKGVLHLEITVAPLRDSKGNIIAGIEVLNDITRRKQTEETLREREEMFHGLIDAIFEGVIIYEEDQIREANKSFSKMFGYELTEVIGKSASEFVTPESYKLIKRNIQHGYEKLYEIKGVKKNGTIFELEAIGTNCLRLQCTCGCNG